MYKYILEREKFQKILFFTHCANASLFFVIIPGAIYFQLRSNYLYFVTFVFFKSILLEVFTLFIVDRTCYLEINSHKKKYLNDIFQLKVKSQYFENEKFLNIKCISVFNM